MNAYLQLLGTIVAQLLIDVFIYGQLTQRVKDQGGWLKKHDSRLDEHDGRIFNHEGRISLIEGQKGSVRSGE